MCEVPLITNQSKPAENNILAQTIKLELVQYFHASLFYSNGKNPPQGNQERFPQDMSGPHIGIDQEAYRKIY